MSSVSITNLPTLRAVQAMAGMKAGKGGIIANPNCSTIIALMAVTPIHRAAGVKRMVVSTYQVGHYLVFLFLALGGVHLPGGLGGRAGGMHRAFFPWVGVGSWGFLFFLCSSFGWCVRMYACVRVWAAGPGGVC